MERKKKERSCEKKRERHSLRFWSAKKKETNKKKGSNTTRFFGKKERNARNTPLYHLEAYIVTNIFIFDEGFMVLW